MNENKWTQKRGKIDLVKLMHACREHGCEKPRMKELSMPARPVVGESYEGRVHGAAAERAGAGREGRRKEGRGA